MLQNTDTVNEANLEELFELWRVYNLAAGEEEGTLKMYFYCKVDSQIACMELEASPDVGTLTLMTKCESEELAGFISKYVEGFLKLNDFI